MSDWPDVHRYENTRARMAQLVRSYLIPGHATANWSASVSQVIVSVAESMLEQSDTVPSMYLGAAFNTLREAIDSG